MNINTKSGSRSQLVFAIVFTYLASALSFGTQFWLAREFTTGGFGKLSYGILLANILQSITLFGTDRTMVRDLVHASEPQNVFWQFQSLKRALATAAYPFLIAVALLNSELDTVPQRISAIALCGTGILAATSPLAWYDINRKYLLQSLIVFLEKLLFTLIVLLAWTQPNLLDMPLAGIAYSLSALGGWYLQWKLIPPGLCKPNTPTRQFGKTVAFHKNLWIASATFGSMLMMYCNQIVLESSCGMAALAAYGLAFQISRVATLFFFQFSRFAAPTIAHITKNPDGPAIPILNALGRHTGLALLIAVPISVLMYCFGSYFVLQFLSLDYEATPRILMILSVWTTLFAPATILTRYMLSLHLERSYVGCSIGFGLLSLVLATLLAPTYQGTGAALALAISHGTSIVFQAFIVLLHLYKRMVFQR